MIKLFALLLALSPCQLKGKVRFVESNADYKVFVGDPFPDLRVKFVNNFPNDPGEWQVVPAFEDFTVQIVQNKSRADFTIQSVEHFPGPTDRC